MLCGRRALDPSRPQAELNLVEWARPYLASKRRIYRVVDAKLGSRYSLNGAQKIANLAVACLHVKGNMRPTMDYVVSILEGVQDSSDPSKKPAVEKHQGPKSAGRMTAPSANAGTHSPRSSGDLRNKAGSHRFPRHSNPESELVS